MNVLVFVDAIVSLNPLGLLSVNLLTVQRVRFLVVIALWAAVKIAAVELVSRMRFRTSSVDRKFTNSLLPSVDLMADRASVLSGLPC